MKRKTLNSKDITNCVHDVLRKHKDYEATVEHITMFYASGIFTRHEYKRALKSIDAKLICAKIDKAGFGEIKIKTTNTILSLLGQGSDQYMYMKITPNATQKFRKDIEKSKAQNNEKTNKEIEK